MLLHFLKTYINMLLIYSICNNLYIKCSADTNEVNRIGIND